MDKRESLRRAYIMLHLILVLYVIQKNASIIFSTFDGTY